MSSALSRLQNDARAARSSEARWRQLSCDRVRRTWQSGRGSVIRELAEWSPFSAAITAARHLFGNGVIRDAPVPLAHPVLTTIIWSIVLIGIFAPLAARRYAKRG